MPPEALVQVLSQLTMPTRAEVLHGPGSLDDAGVISMPGGGPALVQTLDFFPPIVDDPRDFGQIAAANALSDIYAMGATPYSALNLVGFPTKELGLKVLTEILAGGADKMQEAKVALLGGHSVEDAEIKYGLAVTGLVAEDAFITNGGARVGDRLILSKPLGMGSVSTAIRKGKASADVTAAAVATMATLNAGAARAMHSVGVDAVTDVTGFGLLGHAGEIADASGVILELSAVSLPLTDGTLELAGAGIVSGGSGRNRKHLGDSVVIDETIPEEMVALAFDSETSGGLLMAVAEDKAEALISALRNEGTPCAQDIGVVAERDPGSGIKLRLTP